MSVTVFANATLILPDRLERGDLAVVNGLIVPAGTVARESAKVIDVNGAYLAPGFVDLHVHGGDGADFMDGTAEAFRTVCRCHARHGTTSLTPTSTVARMDQYLRFLELCGELHGESLGGARIVGSHFYGPYFARPGPRVSSRSGLFRPRCRERRDFHEACGEHAARHHGCSRTR